MCPRVAIVTGASRGIGAAMTRLFAREGYLVIAAARSLDTPSHPKLRGTLEDVRREWPTLVQPVRADVSRFEDLEHIVEKAREFGPIAHIVHNASVLDVDVRANPERYDRLMSTNSRATALLSELALEHCAPDASMVAVSPPVVPRVDWIAPHSAYTVSKYGMTLAMLGVSTRVRANTVWPTRMIATAATERIESQYGIPAFTSGRRPDYFADVLLRVLNAPFTGRMLLDEQIRPHPPDDAPMDAFVDDAFVSDETSEAVVQEITQKSECQM